MYRREISNSAPSLRLMRRKFPTSAWPRSMSSTRKPPEHLSSAKAYNLLPAAEVAAAEVAEAAQFEAAGAFGGEAAEVAAVVVAGRGEPAETARLGRFPVSLRSS